MFTLKVENTNGQILTLTQNESDYQVVSIDGLNPPKAVINSSTTPGMDGSKFNSSRLEERNIVITVKINGDIERNRINLYSYLRTKQWCKVYYKNGVRDVYIEGYVESIDCDLFTDNELMQISIICQNPYFKELREIIDDVSKLVHTFEFPFSFGNNGATQNGVNFVQSSLDNAKEFSAYDYEKITEVLNESEVEVGVIIELTFSGEVENPKIMDTVTGDTFEVQGIYNVGDKIVINTSKGNKSIKLYRGGEEINLFPQLSLGSTWFQLRIGYNLYTYVARRNDAFMRVVFKHSNMFEGV